MVAKCEVVSDKGKVRTSFKVQAGELREFQRIVNREKFEVAPVRVFGDLEFSITGKWDLVKAQALVQLGGCGNACAGGVLNALFPISWQEMGVDLVPGQDVGRSRNGRRILSVLGDKLMVKSE